MIADLNIAKKPELEAELELYREAGIEDVAKFGPGTKNSDRIAEIERLRKGHGHVYKIDEAFFEANPELAAIGSTEADPLKLGDIVFFTDDELADANRKEAAKLYREELAKVGVETTGEESLEDLISMKEKATGTTSAGVLRAADGADTPSDPVAPPPAPKPAKDPVRAAKLAQANDAQVAAAQELVYLGKTVIRVEARILHGKTYKDVTVATGETFTITPEEFTSAVKPRA